MNNEKYNQKHSKVLDIKNATLQHKEQKMDPSIHTKLKNIKRY
jgi:hypothetical protein